jgi:hypothetical protein
VSICWPSCQSLQQAVTVLPSTGASSTCIKVARAQAEQDIQGVSAQVRMGHGGGSAQVRSWSAHFPYNYCVSIGVLLQSNGGVRCLCLHVRHDHSGIDKCSS